MPPYEFKLPDIGEGVAEGEVLKWLVSEGDTIKEDQPLVEVMTDKVNVEIASPKAGKIARILAQVGQVVKVGTNLVVFDIDEAIPEKSSERSTVTQTPIISQPAQVSRTEAESNLLAAPATRKLASELGVDLSRVEGSGPRGRITPEDVKKAAENRSSPKAVESSTSREEERVPLRGLRKIISERMSKSAHTAAQVTHVDECDVTELSQLRNRLNSDQNKVKITFLPLILKAVIPALKEYRFVNAYFDDEKQEIVLKKIYNVGIATDTEQGLIVPVIKEVDKKDVFELATEIDDLVTKGRSGKLSLDDVRGSTFTLTNVGSVGGLYSTPLVYYPEVAILAVQRIVKRPVVKNDSVVVRDMMNFSLSFDHRAIDGAYAARFTNRVIREIENPTNLVSS